MACPLLLLIGFYVYLNQELLPVKLRALLENKTREALGHTITFDKIFYHPVSGLTLENVVLTEISDTPQPSLTVEKVQLQFPLLSILQKKELIITSIHLEHPVAQLRRAADGQWQFNPPKDTFAAASGLSPTPSPAATRQALPLLGGISINDGKLDIIDASSAQPAELNLDDITMDIQLSGARGLSVAFRSRLPDEDGRLDLDINYHPQEKSFDGQTHIIQFELSRLLPFLPPDTLPFSVQGGLIELADLRWEATLNQPGNFKDIRQWQVAGAMALRGTSLTFRPFYHYVGDIIVQNGTLASTAGKNVRGSMERGQLFGDLRIAQLANFHGLLQGDILSFYKEDETFAVMGDLRGSQAQWQLPQDITINGDFDLTGFKYVQDPTKKILMGALTYPEAIFQYSNYLTGRGQFKSEPFTMVQTENDFDLQLAWQTDDLELHRWDNILSGNFSVDSHVIRTAEEPYQLNALINGSNVNLMMGAGLQFTALPRVSMEMTFDPSGASATTYSGSMFLESGRLLGAGPGGEISGINGQLKLADSTISFDHLELSLLGTPLTLKGTYELNHRQPLNLRAQTTDVDISSWTPLLAAYLNKIVILPGGRLGLTFDYAGSLTFSPSSITQVQAQFYKISLDHPSLPDPIEDITGALRYDRPAGLLETDGLTGTFMSVPYTLALNVRDFTSPAGKFSLVSSDLDLSAEFNQQGRRVNITKAQARLRQSTANLYGAIIDRRRPWIMDINGSVRLETTDLAHLPMSLEQQQRLKDLGLTGLVMLDGYFRGPVNRWQKAAFDLKAESPRLMVSEVPINSWELTSVKRAASTDIQLDSRGRVDDGTLYFSSTLQSDRPGWPGHTEINLKDVRLSRIKSVTPLKSKNWDGGVDISLKLDGPLGRMRELNGNGRLTVRDGYLGKTEILKGLWKMLFLAPGLENALFTQAAAQVEIKEERIYLSNMMLESRPVELFGEGYIDFDKNIDFYFKPSFRESEILSTRSMKTGTSSLLASLADQNVGIHVTGTLSKPQYDKSVLPGGVIKKVTGSIVDGVTGIFEQMLE